MFKCLFTSTSQTFPSFINKHMLTSKHMFSTLLYASFNIKKNQLPPVTKIDYKANNRKKEKNEQKRAPNTLRLSL